MKRTIISMGILVLCVLSSGCGGKPQTVSLEVSTAENSQKEKILLWSCYETEEQQKGLDILIKGFNSSQENYEAVWEYHGPYSEFTKQLSIGVSERRLPDVVIIDNPDMRTYVNLGLFEDITSYVETHYQLETFYPEVINSVCYDGRYYGMPFCCNNVGLFYNKDMLEEAGIEPPADWEEFRAAAKQLSVDNRKGFAMSGIAGEQSAFQLLPWILSTGEDMETLGGTDTEKALSLLNTLVQDKSLSKDCINWSQNDVARKFVSGECAMMENGPWALPVVENSSINYGIAKLPVDQDSQVVAGGENFGVVKGKNTEGVLALIDYYYRDEVMLNINRLTYALPPKRSLAKRMQEQNSDYSVFTEQMDTVISRSSYPFWPGITRAISDAMYNVVTGESSPKEAARSIQTSY